MENVLEQKMQEKRKLFILDTSVLLYDKNAIFNMKGNDIVIVGVDGNSDAVKSIKAGRLNASVAQLPYLVGKRAVIGATVSLHGLKLEKFQFVDTLVLTKDVIESNRHPLMKYVK